MAQTAYNGRMEIPKGVWTLLSEANCTFVVLEGKVELIGTEASVPDNADDHGVPYTKGTGEDQSTDLLSRYAGAGTADALYVMAREQPSVIFLSRPAVL